MSTNLKMHLKPSVQDVWQNLDSGRYTVGGTLVGKAVPKLSFGSLGGWLEGESRRTIRSEVSFRFGLHRGL